MTDETTNIASKHLGSKAGDYSAFQGITEVRSDFLVGVPRELNRSSFSKDAVSGMFGYDVWRGYEVSALLTNGYPITYIAVIKYPSNTPNIIESKSMKLYWNSYNQTKMGETEAEAKKNIERRASADLAQVLWPVTGPAVESWNEDDWTPFTVELFAPGAQDIFGAIEAKGPLVLDLDKLTHDNYTSEFAEIKDYTENRELLGFQYCSYPAIHFKSSVLRSNCRVTKQPDFGDVSIIFYPNRESKLGPSMGSLLRYLVSLRNEAHFHEEIIERIFTTLLETYSPSALMVIGMYTRRGGWDINPVRTTSYTSGGLQKTPPGFWRTNRQ